MSTESIICLLGLAVIVLLIEVLFWKIRLLRKEVGCLKVENALLEYENGELDSLLRKSIENSQRAIALNDKLLLRPMDQGVGVNHENGRN